MNKRIEEELSSLGELEEATWEDLLASEETEDIVVTIKDKKKKITVRRLKTGEIADIFKAVKTPEERMLFVVYKGIVSPKPKSLTEIREMKFETFQQIFTKIVELSGLTEEAQREVKDFLPQIQDGESG